LPDGLTSAAGLPALTARLMERGMSEGDVEKVLGGNFMRVFDAVEQARR
jgi:membrane dipeptidase